MRELSSLTLIPPHHFLIHTKQVQRVSVPRQGSRTVTNRESHFNPIIGTTKDSLSVPLSRDGQINVCRRTRVPFPWSGNDRGQDGRAKQCLGNVPQWSMVQSGQYSDHWSFRPLTTTDLLALYTPAVCGRESCQITANCPL